VFVGAITVVNLSNFVFHVVLNRLLGPASYGALGALLNVTAVLTVPLAALQATVTQSVAERPEGTTTPLGRLLRSSAAPSLVAWHAYTRRVRDSTWANDSSMSPRTRLHGTQGTAEPPGFSGRFRLKDLHELPAPMVAVTAPIPSTWLATTVTVRRFVQPPV
jgi:hypothetical protein